MHSVWCFIKGIFEVAVVFVFIISHSWSWLPWHIRINLTCVQWKSFFLIFLRLWFTGILNQSDCDSSSCLVTIQEEASEWNQEKPHFLMKRATAGRAASLGSQLVWILTPLRVWLTCLLLSCPNPSSIKWAWHLAVGALDTYGEN